MTKPIDFKDLFNRVSDNREFALRMLNSFFDTYEDRMKQLKASFEQKDFDNLADAAHQMKGILGNLALTQGHSLLKSLHESARLKDEKKINKLISSLEAEIDKARQYLQQNLELFN